MAPSTCISGWHTGPIRRRRVRGSIHLIGVHDLSQSEVRLRQGGSQPTGARNADYQAKQTVHRCCLTFDMSGGSKGAKRPLKRPLDGGVRPHSGPDAQHWLDPTIAHSNLRSNCETSALVLYLAWSTLNSPDRLSHLFFRSCALTSRSLSDRFPLNSPAKCSHSSARRRSLFTARGTAALAPLALRSAGLGFLAPWCDASPGAAEACDAL